MSDLLEDGVTVNGREFAAAWLSAFVSASEDDTRPALYRAVSVELYDSARLRCTATDGYMLITATLGGDVDVSEAPVASVAAVDSDRRAFALLRFVHKQAVKAEKDEVAGPMLRLSVRPADQGDDLMLSPDLAGNVLVIESDSESVALRISELNYPDFREVIAGHKPEPVTAIAFTSEFVARDDKLTDVESAPRWWFAGPEGMARIEVASVNAGVDVGVYLMPARRLS